MVATSFAVAPQGVIGYWKSRLARRHAHAKKSRRASAITALRLTDPDGLMLELISSTHLEEVDLNFETDVPPEFALRGFHAPTLEVQKATLTEHLLPQTFGFELVGEAQGRRRFSLDPASTTAHLDVIERPDVGFGNIAAGTVHHIAFRAADEAAQLQWRETLTALGLHVTPVIDRQYFHSIYFREPGGILFEIATDGPGFATDETVEHLGEALRLPPQFEAHRDSIARALPPISLQQARP